MRPHAEIRALERKKEKSDPKRHLGRSCTSFSYLGKVLLSSTEGSSGSQHISDQLIFHTFCAEHALVF